MSQRISSDIIHTHEQMGGIGEAKIDDIIHTEKLIILLQIIIIMSIKDIMPNAVLQSKAGYPPPLTHPRYSAARDPQGASPRTLMSRCGSGGLQLPRMGQLIAAPHGAAKPPRMGRLIAAPHGAAACCSPPA